MGYDQTRFLSKVDDEFICVICTSVIENPVQTPCEHLFCNNCIKDWLDVNKTCPVDGRPLTTNGLTNPNRILRNLLHKLDIKCDFEQDGCQTISKLEHLAQHVDQCVHNMDAEVVCDKGCNTTMTRREYLEHSCVFHLTNEVTKLRDELIEQQCNFERKLDSQAKENIKLRQRLSEQKCYFEQTLDSQAKEIRELRDEIDRQNKERLKNSNSNRQKGEIAELCADISLDELPKWQQIHNMKIGPENVLEKVEGGYAFVQSDDALKPTKSCFEIQLTYLANCQYFHIGLTRRGCFRGLELNQILGAICNDSRNCFSHYLLCKKGDVIECGIEFPEYFIDDDKHSALLYVSVNRNLKFKELRVIPKDGLFQL